jgi:SAM-dependent methyltransferase
MKKIIKKTIRFVFAPFVFFDYLRYKKLDKKRRFAVPIGNVYPCIKDKTITTGFDRHYVYHTSWAARIVKKINPKRHVDISSSLYFCGILSAFIPVDFYDYRPANIGLDNLTSQRGDLMSLPFPSNSICSISCMHTVEHIGLGRYGDFLDSEGDLKAINELKRVVAKGGSLLFVVPVGKPLIAWNAHRIYAYEQIISAFEGFSLKEFSLIPENESRGGLIRNADPKLVKNENYACGCFWFIKN